MKPNKSTVKHVKTKSVYNEKFSLSQYKYYTITQANMESCLTQNFFSGPVQVCHGVLEKLHSLK